MGNEKGFTLLETLVLLLILAIGLMGVAALTTTSIRVNSSANHLTLAYQIAQADLEELRSIPWRDIDDEFNTREHPHRELTFISTWTVSRTGNIKNVSLSVTWNDSKNHQIDLATKIAR
jgi:type IV pilus modification protein PilV